jgi:hypothetical protein
LANRLAETKTLESYEQTRMARFAMYTDPTDTVFPNKRDQFTSKNKGSFLESLMNEIPGITVTPIMYRAWSQASI